jgi:hypothetical protein
MSTDGWSLEVVRGKEAGRVYALPRGQTVLGNALNGAPGLDLAHQEGSSPRRMDARQAVLDWTGASLTLRDLDSLGGTFVNRQRLLPGQALALKAGDVIQLAGVQLRVVTQAAPRRSAAEAAPPPVPASARPSSVPPAPAPPPAPTSRVPGQLPVVFRLATGQVCRTWDDFLTVSAQRWPALREELTSGRLEAYLRSIQRPELAPAQHAPGTADERLDAWLGTLPASKPSRPELEVHPQHLSVRAVAGGGLTRHSLRITNTGYRLLRSTARVEPPGTSWVRLAPEFSKGPFVTLERTDLPVEVEIPESLAAPRAAELVVEGNGGTRRVEIRLEPPGAGAEWPEPGLSASSRIEPGFVAALARLPIPARLALGGAGGLALRVLIVLAGMIVGGRGSAGAATPRLQGAAVLLAALGGCAAAGFALRRGEPRDVPPAAFAGAFAGVLCAALLVAACRAVEPLLGSGLASSPLAVSLLWAILGTGLGGLSVWLIPHSRNAGVSP